jgi:alpha 1,2-mannosyltransferase
MINLENPIISNNYFISEDDVLSIRSRLQIFLQHQEDFDGQKIGTGKGIVISAGGFRYFTTAYILIKMLRNSGCILPVEVWYYDKELSFEMIETLKNLEVDCMDMKEFVDGSPHGFLMKPLSILYSKFREVLFLDADNVCTSDPSYLFEDTNYLECGCIFWPDFWKTSQENPIWRILGLEHCNGWEQESGQLLINKEKCWKELQLTTYFNINANDYYRFIYGDKDTFRFAWMAMGRSFYMIKKPVSSCGYNDPHTGRFSGVTMAQHDSDGRIIFLHRNLLKWDITHGSEYAWKIIKGYRAGAKKLGCSLNINPNHHNSIDLHGDTEVILFDDILPSFEDQCLKELVTLRMMNFYQDELILAHIRKHRY